MEHITGRLWAEDSAGGEHEVEVTVRVDVDERTVHRYEVVDAVFVEPSTHPDVVVRVNVMDFVQEWWEAHDAHQNELAADAAAGI